MSYAYFNAGSKQRERNRKFGREQERALTGRLLTALERECLVRAVAQDGRFYPTGLTSDVTEAVKVSLQRRGFLTNGPGDGPCLTDSGLEALKLTREKNSGR